MLLLIHLPFDLEKVRPHDKAAAIGISYGMDLRSLQKMMDPDLHNPALVHLLDI